MSELQVIRSSPRGPQIFNLQTPNGVAGNLHTLAQMRAAVLRDRLSEPLRRWVHRLVAQNAPHDFEGEVDTCFEFCKTRIKYQRDAFGVQRVADLGTTLSANPITGNCISKSVALATMLALLGQKPFFIIMAQTDWSPFVAGWEFDHVFVGLNLRGYTYPLDPTPEYARPGQGYGPANAQRREYAIF